MNNKGTKYGIILLLLILALTGANLLFGSVNIPADAVWHILTGNEVEKIFLKEKAIHPCPACRKPLPPSFAEWHSQHRD